MLKKGQIVTIYADPYTRETPEGKALLIKKHDLPYDQRNPKRSELWKVSFLHTAPGMYCDRWILSDVQSKEA